MHVFLFHKKKNSKYCSLNEQQRLNFQRMKFQDESIFYFLFFGPTVQTITIYVFKHNNTAAASKNN